jgi:2-oxoglutarate ferredoxin oxidoreductase subunit beta
MLAMMGQEKAECESLPIALGVIRRVAAESYDAAVNAQIEEVRSKSKSKTFDQLTQTLETWNIE